MDNQQFQRSYGVFVNAGNKPYEILGVSPDASPKEIKTAYRKAALANHPDKNPDDPGAGARFQDINMANEILSNPDTRSAYDNHLNPKPPEPQPPMPEPQTASTEPQQPDSSEPEAASDGPQTPPPREEASSSPPPQRPGHGET